MSEYVPVLGVGRSVTNITQEHIEPIEARLLEEAGDPVREAEIIEEVLNPVHNLHTGIISKLEFLYLQRWLGSHRLGHEEVGKLAGHLKERLSDCPETREVRTLPTHFQRWGGPSRYVLTVARSQAMIAERSVAKKAITEFLEVESIPRGIWLPNEKKATEVWLAFCANDEEARLMARWGAIIEEDKPLPVFTQLAEIDFPQSEKLLHRPPKAQD